MEKETTEVFLNKLKHDINRLSDNDRAIRKTGLDNITKEIMKNNPSKENVEILLSNFLMSPLVKCLEDQIEKHRETTIKLYSFLLDFITFDNTLISILITAIISRMDKIPFLEKTEELRLQLLTLLKKIMEKYPDELKAHKAPLAKMLGILLTDPCPEIKIQLGDFITKLSIKLKHDIGVHSKPMVVSLCSNLKHQQNKIRKVTVIALIDLLICDNVGSFINECIPILKLLTVDNNSDVRTIFYTSIAKLLNNLNIVYLRSYEASLVLLLLSGLSDDKENIKTMTISLLEEVGLNRKKLAIETGEDISQFI